MTERKEKIAQLYYQSNSVRFGAFKLSAHKDNPTLPLSPWYLHYPERGQLGSELLPKLHQLVGSEFFDICETQEQPIRPVRVTGLPNGAVPLGKALAEHYQSYPRNLIGFEKIQHQDGRTKFSPPTGDFEQGDDLLPCEDHISGGRNNRLFAAHARRFGFVVTKLLVVVDRQQGGVENMANEGVDVLPIFTADALLDYGLAENHISPAQYEQVQEYRAENQFLLSGLKRPVSQ